jgi:hypothetical protein
MAASDSLRRLFKGPGTSASVRSRSGTSDSPEAEHCNCPELFWPLLDDSALGDGSDAAAVVAYKQDGLIHELPMWAGPPCHGAPNWRLTMFLADE